MFQIGNILMFPMFNHLGANTTSPELCDCDVLTDEVLNDKNHNCNVFRFLSGFIYVNSILDVAYMFAVRDKQGSAKRLNENAHQAMFIASSYGQVLGNMLNCGELCVYCCKSPQISIACVSHNLCFATHFVIFSFN